MKNSKFDNIYLPLKEQYPNAKAELVYFDEFSLLIAVVLSAQCTDKRVNIVTKELFKKYKTPSDFAKLSPTELEKEIHSVGLSKSKAEHIVSLSKKLVNEYNSVVPNTRDQLMSLDGVGRKTANVVLAVAFNKPTIPVDTHVFRVTNRIGIANANNVSATEKQLMERLPKDKWIDYHHLFIFHGRYTCKAINPQCDKCNIKEYCKYYKDKQNVQNTK